MQRTLIALAAVMIGVRGAALPAQATNPGCAVQASRGVAAASGRRISAVHIVTRGPASLPGGLGTPLHVTTRDATVRNRLLFTSGDSVDSLRVAESVRQLRRLRYLAGAAVSVTCDSTGGVVLVVTTRDAWSMKPRLSAGGASGAVAGVEETNIMGSGRAGRVYARSERGQLGIGAAYSDPTLFGTRLLGTISRDAYGDGSAWNAALSTHDAGAIEEWGFSALARQSARLTVTPAAGVAPGDTVRRAFASLLVRRRLSATPQGTTFLLGGAEIERTRLVAGAELPLAGPPSVRRTFAGLDVGLGRRAGQYDVVPWLLPSSAGEGAHLAPAELPAGVEGEGIIGLGRDFSAGRPASRVDLWVGRIWHVGGMDAAAGGTEQSTPRALLSSDVWASGYRSLNGGGEWSAGAIRSALALVAPARSGLWFAQLSGERLVDPDPDLRRLVTVDRAQRALPPGSRLAELAVSGSLERTVQVLGPHRGFVLDGALFAAASARWDVAAPLSLPARAAGLLGGDAELPRVNGIQHVHVGSLGVGVRLTPTRFGRPTLGLDVGFPVLRSPHVPGRPYLAVSIRPAFGLSRGRGVAIP